MIRSDMCGREGLSHKRVKCVVWDLDHTLWEGILLEGDSVKIRAGVQEVIEALDGRGILNSVASRNDYVAAMDILDKWGLSKYFVAPQINWDAKSASIKRIAERLNISVDSLVFIDDQEFERDEVQGVLPLVQCIDARAAPGLLELLDLDTVEITAESRVRRAMYQAEHARIQAKEEYVGTNEEFLATLGLVITIVEASEEDLDRVDELTIRTSQLNSTGRVYSREELAVLRCSPNYRLLVVSLEDRYGMYGRIGLALVEIDDGVWTLKLLVASCRVMSRGIGGVVLHHIMLKAKEARVRFFADFIRTERNRIMLVAYRFAGFKEVKRDGAFSLLEHDLEDITPIPEYIQIVA